MCLLFWRRHLHSSFSTLCFNWNVETYFIVALNNWSSFPSHLLRTYVVTKQFLSSSSLSTIQCEAELHELLHCNESFIARLCVICMEINNPLNIYELSEDSLMRIVQRNFISLFSFRINLAEFFVYEFIDQIEWILHKFLVQHCSWNLFKRNFSIRTNFFPAFQLWKFPSQLWKWIWIEF